MDQLGTDQMVRDWASHQGGWVNVREEKVKGSNKVIFRANPEHVQPEGLSKLVAFGLTPAAARGALWDLLTTLGFAGE
jgi:hypothetical protein